MALTAVSWAAPGPPPAGPPDEMGLRQRKKQLMRQQLSDTATEMFLDRGFDAVRVVEIAEACGVSEKTVYNYFPNKESLLLDRWGTTIESLRAGLADPHVSPVQAAVRILDDELRGVTFWFTAQDDPAAAYALFLRFGAMINSTPALRSYQHDMTDQLITVAAEVLAERIEVDSNDAEVQIAATALIGLWNVQFQSLRKHLDGNLSPRDVHRAVVDDVERAARLIDTGLQSLEQVEEL